MTGPAGRRPAVPAAALVPLRLFLGGTFVYAGFDKLLDPRFFDPSSPASIQAQMLAFARVSPIAPLVRLAQPVAPQIGFLIALAEIAIGIGALTGLAFRIAAWAGAGLSLLFFLTASWATRPFYVGADLPFAAGWITLALAGHGGFLVARRLLDWSDGLAAPGHEDMRGGLPRRRRKRRSGPVAAPDETLPVRDRRSILQAGILGMLAVTAASLAVPFRLAAVERAPAEPDGTGTTSPSATLPSSSPSASEASRSPSASAASGSLVVARTSDVDRTGARSFRVPFTAPAPLPAGDPGVIVRLADGTYHAFDAVCTHAGCTVEWDRADRLLLCPCHGAAFDPADQGAVVEGPTDVPLPVIPIAIDTASGAISLVAG